MIRRRAATRRAAVWVVAASLVATALVQPLPADAAAYSCGEPGKDGATATFTSGVPNSYWAGTANGLQLAAGSTSFVLGAINPNGSQQALSAGDLIMMYANQNAYINPTNSSAYGSGGSSGNGINGGSNAGQYEFARVTSVSGSTVTIVGAGTGGGLVNNYFYAPNGYTLGSTQKAGQVTYQIVRVPQYGTYTVGANLYTTPWNGSSGGIVALDVMGALTLTNPINADGYGFRGGGQNTWGNGYGGTNATSTTQATPDGATDGDYVYGVGSTNTNITTALAYSTYNGGPDGFKGEGIVGTPIWTYSSGASAPAFSPSAATYSSDGNTGSGYGYPGGSKSKGAPGNAGGGAMDGNANGYGPIGNGPAATGNFNQYNSGGGGGANGGAGGLGGENWASTQNSYTAGSTLTQGIGGAAMTPTISQVIFGGGGGAGSNNDGSVGNKVITVGGGVSFTPTAATASSGASGGGLIFLRVGSIASGTLSANGISAPDPNNDGGGGGGGGGSIVVLGTGTVAVTANANGGSGANSTGGGGDTATGYNTPGQYEHGTGGGGGGGVVFNSGTGVTANVAGGAAGNTAGQTGTSVAATYYATAGGAGVHTTGASATSATGIAGGASCRLLLLAKRYTSYTQYAGNGGAGTTAYTGYTSDGYTDPNSSVVVDTDPLWPQSGGNPQILGNVTQTAQPKDSVEYTIYMLSAGGAALSSGVICDYVPPDQTLTTTTYSGSTAMKVSVGYSSPTVTYFGAATTAGGNGYYALNPATGATVSGTITLPTTGCGTPPKSTVTGNYSTAAIVWNLTTGTSGAVQPYFTTNTGYAKVSYTASIN
jgi:hypothetical protein